MSSLTIAHKNRKLVIEPTHLQKYANVNSGDENILLKPPPLFVISPNLCVFFPGKLAPGEIAGSEIKVFHQKHTHNKKKVKSVKHGSSKDQGWCNTLPWLKRLNCSSWFPTGSTWVPQLAAVGAPWLHGAVRPFFVGKMFWWNNQGKEESITRDGL